MINSASRDAFIEVSLRDYTRLLDAGTGQLHLSVCLFVICSFGVIPTSPLPIHTPLMPSQSIEVSLPINTVGPVMKMDPLNNLQVQKLSLADQTFEQQRA